MTIDSPLSSLVIETARQAKSLYRRSFDGSDNQVVRLPEAALVELVRRLATAVGGRICQIVPFSPHRRIIDEFSHLVLGELANGQAMVERLYLVPTGYAHGAELQRRITDDHSRHIDARKLMVGTGLAHLAPAAGMVDLASSSAVAMRDVWLVDDQIVIRQEFGAEGPPDWVVSTRAQDVQYARRLWQRLWPPKGIAAPDHALLQVSDPILESAHLIHSTAQLSCPGDHIDEVSCGWYHGVWQYLRLLDMVSSPRWHADFYLDALRTRLSGAGSKRVLISGTADYAVLAFVLAACEARTGELDIHVLDKCTTPLFACQWYARRQGVDVTVHAMDLLDDGAALARHLSSGAVCDDNRFNVIVSDAFLTRFSRERAEMVLRRWAGLLGPGGTVVTTVRLHPRNGPRNGVAQDVTDFLMRLRSRWENWRWLLKIDESDLIDAAREYALKMVSRDLGDLDDVVDLFHANGFDVNDSNTAAVEGELCPTAYVRIVATVRDRVRDSER